MTAIHEAGHALQAKLDGLDVFEVWIATSDGSGPGGYTQPVLGNIQSTLRNRCAGPAAEVLFGVSPEIARKGTDFGGALKDLLNPQAIGVFDELVEPAEKILDRVFLEVQEKFVAMQAKNAITVFAEAILGKPEMMGPREPGTMLIGMTALHPIPRKTYRSMLKAEIDELWTSIGL